MIGRMQLNLLFAYLETLRKNCFKKRYVIFFDYQYRNLYIIKYRTYCKF